MKGLILAGGHGTRLRPLTFSGNKHMLPIANRPMIEYSIDHLREAGVTDIGLIMGPIREGIMEFLGDGSRLGVNLTYINQPEPKGLAHAVMTARSFLGEEDFVMYLGDNLLEAGAAPLVNAFREGNHDCVVGVAKVSDPERYGVVVMDGGKAIRVIEKPREFISDLALIGVYVFNRRIHQMIGRIKPSWRNELEITDAIQELLNSKGRVHVIHVTGWWKDAGRSEDFLEANRLVLSKMEGRIQGRIEPGATIGGSVTVGEESLVKTGSRIAGPAVIGKKCLVGPGALIGPFTSVGDGSTIVETEVANSIVMENCRIVQSGKIVGSLIGRSSVISQIDGGSTGKKMVLGERTVIEG